MDSCTELQSQRFLDARIASARPRHHQNLPWRFVVLVDSDTLSDTKSKPNDMRIQAIRIQSMSIQAMHVQAMHIRSM